MTVVITTKMNKDAHGDVGKPDADGINGKTTDNLTPTAVTGEICPCSTASADGSRASGGMRRIWKSSMTAASWKSPPTITCYIK